MSLNLKNTKNPSKIYSKFFSRMTRFQRLVDNQKLFLSLNFTSDITEHNPHSLQLCASSIYHKRGRGSANVSGERFYRWIEWGAASILIDILISFFPLLCYIQESSRGEISVYHFHHGGNGRNFILASLWNAERAALDTMKLSFFIKFLTRLPWHFTSIWDESEWNV
jgi:hypothetical protein